MNAPPKPVSLLPREHGAYAEMAFPLITALIVGGFAVPSLLLTTAVVCAFLLHEPALVMMGRRGPRALQAAGARAQKRATILIAIAAASGVTGLFMSDPSVWLATLGLVGLGILVVLVTAARLDQTTLGQTVVAITLAGAAVPVALAGSVALTPALILAGVWAVVFVLGTITVNVIIDRHKARRHGPALVLIGASLLIGAGLIRLGISGHPERAFLAVLPVIAVAVLVLVFRLGPRRLRWLGWSMVVANAATLVMLLMLLPD